MPVTDKETGLRKLCMMLYGIYALSVVLQFAEETLLIGLIALIIAYVLTKARHAAAQGTPYASHLRWMLRTFWIGTGVIVPVAVIIATGLILTFTDIATIVPAMNNDDPGDIMGGVQAYMDKNLQKISLITFLTLAPTVIWWLRRCWVGYALAKNEKPVENVTTWL